MRPNLFLSEVFKIIEGASRLDSTKVRNYSNLLVEKLEEAGEPVSARRLRKILDSPTTELRPAFTNQRASTIPVDAESRFPLLEESDNLNEATSYLFEPSSQEAVNEFCDTVFHREVLLEHGINTASTLLLYGPPGCGKSHLARIIAKKLRLPLMIARIDGIVSSYLGNTAKNLRAVFEYAARTPCVLFLDEFDALAKIRDDNQELGELKRVVNSFIQTLDFFSQEIVLIAATNHDQLLDTAVWRRFSCIQKIDLPNSEQRKELWRLYSRSLSWTEKELAALEDLSEGFSGSAIKEASDRMLQKFYVSDQPKSLRTALDALIKYKSHNQTPSFLDKDLLKNPTSAFDALRKRNNRLYTQELVSEIVGISRATLNRARKPPLP